MTRFGASVFLALGLMAWAPVQAQIQTLWKCTDKNGRTLFTSQRADTVGKQCKVASEERVSSAPTARAKSPANFPRESAAERVAARTRQRETLERELAQEESMLADARKKLSEQEAIRTAGAKNEQPATDRLRPYQDTVEVHQKNVESLRRELSNLSR